MASLLPNQMTWPVDFQAWRAMEEIAD